MVEMILFDMDGTLWDTVNTTVKAVKIISEKYEDVKEISEEIVTKSMGLGFSDVAKNYMPYLEKDRREAVLKEIMAKNLEVVKNEGADIYPSVHEVIKELSKRYSIGIVTNNFTEYAELFVDTSGLKPYFTDYLGASSLGKSKADAITTILKKYNVSKAVYVGDTKGDMESSKEAGVIFIHAKYGFDKTLSTDYQIDNFSELMDTIKEIESK